MNSFVILIHLTAGDDITTLHNGGGVRRTMDDRCLRDEL